MNSNCLYFDCFSGISGDMTVGALLDLGIDQGLFQGELGKLNLSGYTVEIAQTVSYQIAATQFKVRQNHEHHHRGLTDILHIIETSSFATPVKSQAAAIFKTLAEAEAKVHNTTVDKIHFHEIGAVDSIVDITATALCLHLLKIDTIVCSALPLGRGFVNTAHGQLPIPAPATSAILQGINVYGTSVDSELVTPTGAAIVKTLAHSFGPLPHGRLVKTGYGLGTKDLGKLNALRIHLLALPLKAADNLEEELIFIETNIDNMNPEAFSFVFDALFDLGALDVYLTPVYMKKNRPGFVLSVLCEKEKAALLKDQIFFHTTSLGLRQQTVQRESLKRKIVVMQTPLGEVRVKIAFREKDLLRAQPEYEDCARLARAGGLSFQDVYNRILSEINQRQSWLTEQISP